METKQIEIMNKWNSIVFSFSKKALEYKNLIELIIRRKVLEFNMTYPDSKDVTIMFFEYDAENFINNRITLRVEGKQDLTIDSCDYIKF